jgi:hypothetical protein
MVFAALFVYDFSALGAEKSYRRKVKHRSAEGLTGQLRKSDKYQAH